MKDIILDRLSKMEDLEQRKLLKNIMAGFFTNLIDYQETMNKSLEERVFAEVEDVQKKYDVYVTVCHKNDVDPVDAFLYPVFPEDMEDTNFDLKEIAKKLEERDAIKLFTVFMKCGYKEIQELIKGKKRYRGEIITTQRRYGIEIRLEQNQSYLKEIENLYHIFQSNDIPWKTINHPYANKFFDVVLAECEGGLNPTEEITEITFHLNEYEQFKRMDMVPLWNIERLSLKSDGFPMPALDRVNFEHAISLKKTGTDHGYLVDREQNPIRYIKRSPEELIIVSPEEKAGVWNILKVTQPAELQNRKLEFALISNSRKNSFINRFAAKQAAIIRTKGEIIRIVNSFEISKYFEMREIEIFGTKTTASTYDMNSFIIDDIRVGNDKKSMKLYFGTNLKDSFIVYDLLSFIVSEIQMYFPEYECQGVLV
ncbi:MAG: normocyte-binding protein [Clostridia bacterium]|nr:normocyte-binding protein [Clostridia bacterium]